MRSTGFELGASHRYERGSFQFNTTATFTTSANKVLSLGNGGQPIFDIATGVARTAVGQPIGSFYVLKTNGIFQSQAEIDAYTKAGGGAIQPNAQPGDVRYVDVNGDGQINLDDRYNAGNGLPKYQGGVFFDGKFRSFDFGLNLRGAGGFKIFNGVRYWTDRMDDPSNYRAGFSPWTPDNPSTTTPRALARGSDNSQFLSDRWVEDGDYLRIQNIVLGYTLPNALVGGLLGSDAQPRIYLNLQNVHTFTEYSNWDPETIGFNDPLGRGIDFGLIYPNVRTVTFGIDLRL
jgi:hypothetical protein